mmetsp:Transcript_9452/g.31429  ORF Transcript_9452/g.31429 Transcript_9452/m.31429 type:complete len:307 (+) Transcript_9452:813-1733(+)
MDSIVVHDGLAPLEDGHARALVVRNVVTLDPAAALIRHQHARVQPRVDPVAAHVRVGVGEDGDAGAGVAADLVVGNHGVGGVAHQHADPLGVADQVVRQEAARVGALHHHAVPGGRGDDALIEHDPGAAFDEHRASHRRVGQVRLLPERQVSNAADHYRRGLDRRAVGADDDGGGVAAHTHQFDRLVDCDLLKVDARTDQDAVVRLAAEHRRIDGAEDAGLAAAGIDHQRRPARRRRQRDGAHDVERKPTQLLLHYVPRAGAGGGGGAAQRRGDGSRSEIGQGCGASRQRAPSRAPRPPKLELLLP